MKIYCVIVCYNPDFDNLSNICQAILINKGNVVLVDNSSSCYIQQLAQDKGSELIFLGGNEGIAKAQNIGIKRALENQADIIAFFDQDSQISNDFLSKLTTSLKADEPKVVSPIFYDKVQNFRFPNYKLNKYGFVKQIFKENDGGEYEVDIIISSGSAASKSTFDVAGLMNENFFIDFVDTEWVLRCRAKGIPVVVVPEAVMTHTIGEKSINLGVMRIFIHSPERSYYKVRNAFLFFKSEYVPFLMGLKEIFSALVHNLLTVFIVKNKRNYIKNYLEAIYDGILGKTGKK